MQTDLTRHPYASEGLTLVPSPEDPRWRLPHDHGDARSEARAALETAALFDGTAQGLLAVTGPDAGDLLQRLLSGDVAALGSNGQGPNLLLSARGRVRFCFELESLGGSFRIVTAPGQAEALAQALEAFVFTEEVGFGIHSDETAPLELVGPRADRIVEEVLGRAALIDPADALDHEWRGAPLRITRPSLLGLSGWRLDAGWELAPRLWEELRAAGAVAAGLAAREALRIAARVPLVGRELPRSQPSAPNTPDEDAGPYPCEANLERAFSLSKGCYVGQEVVAKLDTYGGRNHSLVALSVSAQTPIEPGTALLTAGDQEAGRVTSWCEALLRETPTLLALRKERLKDAGPLYAGKDGPRLEEI